MYLKSVKCPFSVYVFIVILFIPFIHIRKSIPSQSRGLSQGEGRGWLATLHGWQRADPSDSWRREEDPV